MGDIRLQGVSVFTQEVTRASLYDTIHGTLAFMEALMSAPVFLCHL